MRGWNRLSWRNDQAVLFRSGGVRVENQIRTYWWCSPPRIGRQRICPARSTARENGASFSNDRCVRTLRQQQVTEVALAEHNTARTRDRGSDGGEAAPIRRRPLSGLRSIPRSDALSHRTI